MQQPVAFFVPTDAWLLLSVLYAQEGADHDTIRRIGDGISHAEISEDELERGLLRLRACGFLAERDGRFSPSEAMLAWYERALPRGEGHASIHTELQRVKALLHVRG